MADLAKIGEVRTIEFDHEIKDTWLRTINELLTQGWEIIDAKVCQNASHRDRKVENPIIQWGSYAFILGKPR